MWRWAKGYPDEESPNHELGSLAGGPVGRRAESWSMMADWEELSNPGIPDPVPNRGPVRLVCQVGMSGGKQLAGL